MSWLTWTHKIVHFPCNQIWSWESSLKITCISPPIFVQPYMKYFMAIIWLQDVVFRSHCGNFKPFEWLTRFTAQTFTDARQELGFIVQDMKEVETPFQIKIYCVLEKLKQLCRIYNFLKISTRTAQLLECFWMCARFRFRLKCLRIGKIKAPL